MVMTAVSIGMCVSEVLGLKWWNVDLEERAISVGKLLYRGDTDECSTSAQMRPVIEVC
jgi:hypothetical protein